MAAKSPYQILRYASLNLNNPIKSQEVRTWLSCLAPYTLSNRSNIRGDIVLDEEVIKNVEWVPKLAVGVSGGADSLLLAYLLNNVLGPSKVQAFVIDHALRPESAQEAERTLERLAKMGIEASRININWGNSEPNFDSYALNSGSEYAKSMDYFPGIPFPMDTKLEQSARIARYGALLKAMWHTKTFTLALGHHWNDAAETSLYRFARESGISGLPGLHPIRTMPTRVSPSGGWNGYENQSGVLLFRPMLLVPKSRILETARYYGIDWVEDPTNHITTSKHQRSVIRSTMASWEASSDPSLLPLQSKNLELWINHMNKHAHEIQIQVLNILAKDVVFRPKFGMCEMHIPAKPEINHWFKNKFLAVRVLMTISRWISCSDYAPRLAHTILVWEAMSGKPSTLYSASKTGQFCLQLGKAQLVSPSKKTPYWAVVYSSFGTKEKRENTFDIPVLILDEKGNGSLLEPNNPPLLPPMKPGPIWKKLWGHRFHITISTKSDFRLDPVLLHWARIFLPTLNCLPLGEDLCQVKLLPLTQSSITQVRSISLLHKSKLPSSLQHLVNSFSYNLWNLQNSLTVESVRSTIPCLVLRIHTQNMGKFASELDVPLRTPYVDVPLGLPTVNNFSLFPYIFDISSIPAFPTMDMLFPGVMNIPRRFA